MASRSSGTPPPSHHSATTTNRESFLSRKKKEIVDRSMDLFQTSLNKCLDNSASSASAAAGAAAVAPKRRVKRGREDDVDESNRSVAGGDKVKKKKFNPKEGNGKTFACPFCKHDPAKYKKTKTCCGPGWEDVHRVKEHVYRRHSLKNFCPRCFDHFDKPELLKNHQRADVPCKLREKSSDAITEEQEKQLRTRAKPHASEEDKWKEMYRAIFPGEKVPSPYYDSENDAASKAAKSQFQNLDECKEYLRRELPRVVRTAMEQYVNKLFEDIQEKANQKTAEIIRDVETTMLRTFQFQAEISTTTTTATTTNPDTLLPHGGGGGGVGSASSSRPSTPPSPSPGAVEIPKVTQLLDGLREDPVYNELCNSLQYGVVDQVLSGGGLEYGCDTFSMDSAYYSLSEHGSLGVGGGFDFMGRLE
ncbi:uncharacterized protein B0H64DRAFT_404907 [Chaetomium fimeti]|uniref:C2H2-type domain-containing protein n=1 Tax=Chaetomium fimeti TaxID=1854472 RepID=A0AAE0LQI4_9PEZI|nr:hypothetical protein B0H64DRAFT_404907 [Chaetomium fimeti]